MDGFMVPAFYVGFTSDVFWKGNIFQITQGVFCKALSQIFLKSGTLSGIVLDLLIKSL